MENQLRGSDALLDAYKAERFTLNQDLVEELARRVSDLKLHDVFVKGIPAPDFIKATFAANGAEKAGSAISEILAGLVGEKVVPGEIRVFPRGIPWPDEFLIDVTIAERQY